MTMAGTSLSPLSMVAGEDLAAHRLVKLNGSTEFEVVFADAGDRAIGVTLVRADSGESIAIEMMSVGSTLKVTSAGVITVNSVVYTANDGKVSDSVQGDPIGTLRKAGTTDGLTELIPYGQSGGASDTDLVEFVDEFFYANFDESGSEGAWLLDANNGGAITQRDEHGGVIDFDASDTTAADNDETYASGIQQIYLPAAGERMILTGLFKLTEAATDDANIIFGLTSDGTDLADFLLDDGAGPQDAATHMVIYKVDGGTVWRGSVRDAALDDDADVGAFVDATYQELKIVVDSVAGATQLTVEFFIDGVGGGTKDFAVASATEMRIAWGVKNGGAANETLLVDKIRIEFVR